MAWTLTRENRIVRARFIVHDADGCVQIDRISAYFVVFRANSLNLATLVFEYLAPLSEQRLEPGIEFR